MSWLVKKVPIEMESYIFLGGTIILLALFAQRYIFGQRYQNKNVLSNHLTKISENQTAKGEDIPNVWYFNAPLLEYLKRNCPIFRWIFHFEIPIVFLIINGNFGGGGKRDKKLCGKISQEFFLSSRNLSSKNYLFCMSVFSKPVCRNTEIAEFGP